MTQSKSKEISAQKLCAGTVSGATHKAGGLYKRHQFDALRLAKLLIIFQATAMVQRRSRTIPDFH
jgi:hypothetical protein